uniref:Uncharacterized protein n=1 Tax=Gorilla gorilla gorilla TaxID=9595 RepID=A0A2I2YKM3_GORGO
MKPYRQREKQGTNVADSSKGPDEAKIKALLERAGYTLDVTTGQRKYGGPPPDSVYSVDLLGELTDRSMVLGHCNTGRSPHLLLPDLRLMYYEKKVYML